MNIERVDSFDMYARPADGDFFREGGHRHGPRERREREPPMDGRVREGACYDETRMCESRLSMSVRFDRPGRW